MLRSFLSPLLSNGGRRALPLLKPLSSLQSRNFCSQTLNPPNSQANDTDHFHEPSISIDRSGLFNRPVPFHERKLDSKTVEHLKRIKSYQGGPITVADYMAGIIMVRNGPISVAEYNEEVLTNPQSGFYINRVMFGNEGDFITSPEVSQMFGEMVGVWTMCLWEQMGQPEKVNLVELGPGRRTLIADLLRSSMKFVNFTKSLNIHMVECNPTLRKLQFKTLKCMDEVVSDQDSTRRTISMLSSAPISWHATLREVPTGSPTIIIAHEFYDALPVHQFQKSPSGWREKMVDISDDASFRFVLSPQPTPATKLYLKERVRWAGQEEIAKLEHIEVCPEAMVLTHQIAKRISSDGGGALVIDYGHNKIISDSLQAIREHKFVDILDNPGTADLSAYVDFASIRHSAEEASDDISVHGPMTQSQFLGSLGINSRMEALLQNCTEEQAESLRSSYWRLVGDGEAPFSEGPDEQTPIGMGTRYLAMAIVNKQQGTPVPFE